MTENYSNIREVIGGFIGKTISDISQHDPEEFDRETGEGSYVMLLFTDGSSLKFPIKDAAFEAMDMEGEETDDE